MSDSDPVYLFRYIKDGPYVMVPTNVFDILMRELTSSEFKILMFILRKTFGFQKTADKISYSQIHLATGIRGKATISTALKGLSEMGLIIKTRKSRTDINEYSLNLNAKASPKFKN